MLNEYYQRSLQLPEGLEVSDSILRESFPAAIRIGGDMVSQGNMLGAELIQSAQLAFVDGMIASAWVGATIALTNAILVWRYMPSRAIYEEE